VVSQVLVDRIFHSPDSRGLEKCVVLQLLGCKLLQQVARNDHIRLLFIHGVWPATTVCLMVNVQGHHLYLLTVL
jgi:hypothetical protein